MMNMKDDNHLSTTNTFDCILQNHCHHHRKSHPSTTLPSFDNENNYNHTRYIVLKNALMKPAKDIRGLKIQMEEEDYPPTAWTGFLQMN